MRRVVACYTWEVVEKVERRVATCRMLLGYEFFFFNNFTTECSIVPRYSCSSKPLLTCCKIVKVFWGGPYPSTFAVFVH